MNLFAKLFQINPKTTPQPFSDPDLGEFEFEQELGWKRLVSLGQTDVELVLGSSGEAPSPTMLQMAKAWITDWGQQEEQVKAYMQETLNSWPDDERIDSSAFEIESINLLWEDQPQTSMIYFKYPGDEIRLWHVTCDGFTPTGFAYDD